MSIQKPEARQKPPAIPQWRSRRIAVFVLLLLMGLLLLFELSLRKEKSTTWRAKTITASSLATDKVAALCVDSRGWVWAGTNGKGLKVYYTNDRWETFTTDNSALGGNEVYSVAGDDQGQVWVGNNKGLSVDKLGWTTYIFGKPGTVGTSILSLAVDHQGRVWAGTDGGLLVLSPDGDWTTYNLANSGPGGNRVASLAVDDQGRVWVGTGAGLLVQSPEGGWIAYDTASGLAGDEIYALTMGDQGQVWVGTNGGLSVRNPDGRWLAYTPANSGLGGNRVRAVAVDRQGRVWAGTNAGLSVLNPDGSWITPGAVSWLPQKDVSSIAIDDIDQVWVSAGGELRRLAPEIGFKFSPQAAVISTLGWAALLGLGLVLGVLLWRWYPQTVPPDRLGAPLPVIETATPFQMAVPGSGLIGGIQNPPQEAVARLLEKFRSPDPIQRQQALAELEKIGEVEEF